MTYTQGFLFDIFDKNDKLVGSLLGTLHELDSEALFNLHPNIHARLERATKYFVEKIDPEERERMEKNSSVLNAMSDEKLSELTKGVDEYLLLLASKQNKNIAGLETQASREEADSEIEFTSKREAIEIEKEEFVILSLNKVIELNEELKSKPHLVSSALEKIKTQIECILKVIKLQESIQENKELYGWLNHLINNVSKKIEKLNSVNSKLNDIALGLNINPLFLDPLFLEKELKNQCDLDKKHDDEYPRRLQESYIKGLSDKVERHVDPDSDFSKALDDLTERFMQIRDQTIHRRMIEDLKENTTSCNGSFSFFSVGYSHILKEYPNSLVHLIEDSGYKVKRVDNSCSPEFIDEPARVESILDQEPAAIIPAFDELHTHSLEKQPAGGLFTIRHYPH